MKDFKDQQLSYRCFFWHWKTGWEDYQLNSKDSGHLSDPQSGHFQGTPVNLLSMIMESIWSSGTKKQIHFTRCNQWYQKWTSSAWNNFLTERWPGGHGLTRSHKWKWKWNWKCKWKWKMTWWTRTDQAATSASKASKPVEARWIPICCLHQIRLTQIWPQSKVWYHHCPLCVNKRGQNHPVPASDPSEQRSQSQSMPFVFNSSLLNRTGISTEQCTLYI